MNTYTLWNEDWKFVKEAPGPDRAANAPGEAVTLPHTWNAVDGQDGGNDYYRGTCWYVKRFPAPALEEGGGVVNWFDREDEIVKEGCFSVPDSMGDVKAHPQAGPVLAELLEPLQDKVAAAYGDVAKNVQMPENIQKMMDRMSVQDTLKQMGGLVTPEFVHQLNAALNKVKK